MSDVARNNIAGVRIGVLGCGQIAQSAHFESVRKARNATLHAICDRAEDLVTTMTAIHHPETSYISYEEMLSDPAIDAIIVAIADQFHVSATLQALDAGKHVLVEKPLGVTVEECRQVVAKARETGLVVQVGTNKRFDPGISYAREFIHNEMGEMLAFKAWYCDSSDRYAMTDALQPIIETSSHSLRPPGNPKADRERYYLLGHGSHLVDTARFLGGEIESVEARLVEKYGAYSWFVDTQIRQRR